MLWMIARPFVMFGDQSKITSLYRERNRLEILIDEGNTFAKLRDLEALDRQISFLKYRTNLFSLAKTRTDYIEVIRYTFSDWQKDKELLEVAKIPEPW